MNNPVENGQKSLEQTKDNIFKCKSYIKSQLTSLRYQITTNNITMWQHYTSTGKAKMKKTKNTKVGKYAPANFFHKEPQRKYFRFRVLVCHNYSLLPLK